MEGAILQERRQTIQEKQERGHSGKLSGPCTAQSPVPFLDPTLAPAFLCIPWSWKESDFFFFFFLVKVES